jgi:methyl-accepting chemotaxis protein|tara:strand:- start:391 stop:621 length:231 start_codon:yes stop_codon:yes gene_type:complete
MCTYVATNSLFQTPFSLTRSPEKHFYCDGDLTLRLPVHGSDEITDISGAFKVFVGNINNIISQVLQTAKELSQSAT